MHEGVHADNEEEKEEETVGARAQQQRHRSKSTAAQMADELRGAGARSQRLQSTAFAARPAALPEESEAELASVQLVSGQKQKTLLRTLWQGIFSRGPQPNASSTSPPAANEATCGQLVEEDEEASKEARRIADRARLGAGANQAEALQAVSSGPTRSRGLSTRV